MHVGRNVVTVGQVIGYSSDNYRIIRCKSAESQARSAENLVDSVGGVAAAAR